MNERKEFTRQRSIRTSTWWPIYRGMLVGLAVAVVVILADVSARRSDIALTQMDARGSSASTEGSSHDRVAEFGVHDPDPDTRQLADWAAASRDHGDAGFVIVDKPAATLYVFDAEARLLTHTPVLLGSARGDDSVPGIGLRAIEDVLPAERTTPAGRFVAERGRNTLGDVIVWVDYDAAVSIHAVRAYANPKERRLERLATPTIDDNRISYGCINVPVTFFEAHVLPLFAQRRAVVYVVPEVKSAQEVFGLNARADTAFKDHDHVQGEEVGPVRQYPRQAAANRAGQ
ncbi:MAG: hypothetical protein H7125_09890 [Proteobacteria bacterium]|nr:hypothetical protein [Burkholderiales bacterium]